MYFWVVEAKMFKSDGFTRLTRLTRNRILSHPRFLFFPDILRNRLWFCRVIDKHKYQVSSDTRTYTGSWMSRGSVFLRVLMLQVNEETWGPAAEALRLCETCTPRGAPFLICETGVACWRQRSLRSPGPCNSPGAPLASVLTPPRGLSPDCSPPAPSGLPTGPRCSQPFLATQDSASPLMMQLRFTLRAALLENCIFLNWEGSGLTGFLWHQRNKCRAEMDGCLWNLESAGL